MARLGGGVCCCWGLVLLWAAAGVRAGEASGGVGRPALRGRQGGLAPEPPRWGGLERRETEGLPPALGVPDDREGLSRRRSPARGSAAALKEAARLARARPGGFAGLRASSGVAVPRCASSPAGSGGRGRPIPPWKRVRGGEGPRPPAVQGPSRRLSPSTPRRDPEGRGGARLPHGHAARAPHGPPAGAGSAVVPRGC